MLIVVVHHKVHPGKLAEAKRRIADNTRRMLEQPGILFRHTGATEDPEEIVTVTGWTDQVHKDAWDELRRISPPPGHMSDFYMSWKITDIRVIDQGLPNRQPT